MQAFPSLAQLHLQNTWVTIGSFDGVHRGHQEVLDQLVSRAHAAGEMAVVVTFYPHPATVLRGLKRAYYLTTPEEKESLMAQAGVDTLVTLAFNRQMAAMPARAFMAEIHAHLGLKQLWVGYDFSLGRGREGDVSALRRLGQEFGYTVKEISPLTGRGEIISSSRIRAALSGGDVGQAAWLLGRSYRLQGEVISGDGRGRTIGIPTANLKMWELRLLPGKGVYACRAALGSQRYAAVVNIGVRPTFESEPVAGRIEAHLLDVDQDLYGQTLELEFLARLRDEHRFSSPEALVSQIRSDIAQTREIVTQVDF